MTASEQRARCQYHCTVTLAVPLTPFSVAVMVVLPGFTLVVSPWLPLVLLTAATAVFEEDQLTCVVQSAVELSANVPVACDCTAVPEAIVGDDGVTAIDARGGDCTVKFPLTVWLPLLAVMVVVPYATVVTSPFVPVLLLMVATPVFEVCRSESVGEFRSPTRKLVLSADRPRDPSSAPRHRTLPYFLFQRTRQFLDLRR